MVPACRDFRATQPDDLALALVGRQTGGRRCPRQFAAAQAACPASTRTTTSRACARSGRPDHLVMRSQGGIQPTIQSRAYRRLGARSPWAVSITYGDGSSRARPGCHGTTRGTSANHTPVRCVLSTRPCVAYVQVERLERPSGPSQIRGFRVRAPGAPPAKTLSAARPSWNQSWNHSAFWRGRSSMVSTRPGHIERLPSGSYRVIVCAGTDPLTGRRLRPVRRRSRQRRELPP
jgi:hypothetical protein